MKFPKEFKYYGGCVALANALDVLPQRVRNWKIKDNVPHAWRREVREQVKRLSHVDVEPGPEPVSKPEPQPTIDRVRLSDIVDMIADYIRERGL